MINRLAIDLYQGNGVIDFRAVYASGIRLVIHKASEGSTFKDRTYAERRKAARDAGLMWGAYHFGRGFDVDKQIANFLNAATPDDQTRLVLDWEVPEMSPVAARMFLNQIDAEVGRKTVIYSYSSFLAEQLGKTPDPFFGSHPLWIAQYSDRRPVLQPSWSKFLLWQYSDGANGPDPHQVAGITGDVDCNHFDGTEAELMAAWLHGDGEVPMKPSEPAPNVEPWDTPGWRLLSDARLAWTQSQLNHLMPGSPALLVDGLNGPHTMNAVRAFQRAQNLLVDGIVGERTMARLKAVLAQT